MTELSVYLSSKDEQSLTKGDIFYTIPSEWLKNEREKVPDLFQLLNKKENYLLDLYAIWKNDLSDFVGYSHSECYFSFSSGPDALDASMVQIGAREIHLNKWRKDQVIKLCSNTYNRCAFIPRFSKIKDVFALDSSKTIEDIYYSRTNNKKHICDLSTFINENYKQYYDSTDYILKNDILLSWKIFLFDKQTFHDFCSFIFSVINFYIKKYSPEELQQIDFKLIFIIVMSIYGKYLSNIDGINCNYLPVSAKEETYFSFKESKKIVSSIIRKEKTYSISPAKKNLYGEKINLTMSFDDNYAPHACAVINSLLAHTQNAKDIDLYIIHGRNLSQHKIEELKSIYKNRINLIFKVINNKCVKDLPLDIGYISEITYYRLFLQDIIPSSVKRIIYLDTDIIICDDIVDLWNMDLKNHVIAGIKDLGHIKKTLYAGGRPDSIYVNAGILLLDIELAQKRYGRLSQHFLDVFEKNKGKIRCQDQDIINLAFRDDILALPLRWNFMFYLVSYGPRANDSRIEGDRVYTLEEFSEAVYNLAIFHFLSCRKPWKLGTITPFKELYWHYRSQTPNFRPTLLERFCRWNNYVVFRGGFLCIFFNDNVYNFPIRPLWTRLKKRLRLN